MVVSEIPIIDEADQAFSVILSGFRTDWRVRYNPTTDRWSFDLSVTGQPILSGRRIVTGIDLIAPFDLGIGRIVALDYEQQGNLPDRNNLPTRRVRLYHIQDD